MYLCRKKKKKKKKKKTRTDRHRQNVNNATFMWVLLLTSSSRRLQPYQAHDVPASGKHDISIITQPHTATQTRKADQVGYPWH
ncbi:hypothetical protein VN97_g11428 [Penicillium thymicola]|uniref:Uncharacterized protein n=1 Tax=Penicillium thymicola TaxID=293382 RepID=A0AAI9X382_PENTH|nr:hypothetical protein VN97_g11428 [Penicillium thymicola]